MSNEENRLVTVELETTTGSNGEKEVTVHSAVILVGDDPGSGIMVTGSKHEATQYENGQVLIESKNGHLKRVTAIVIE